MIKLENGDFFDKVKEIENNSIDMVIADLPYGVTQNKWDSEINLERFWKEIKRIRRKGCPIIMFSQNLFTARLMTSNEKEFRYTLVWDKVNTTGFLNANRMPLRVHEDILVFYDKLPTYNPQKFLGDKPNHSRGTAKNPMTNNNYGKFDFVDTNKEVGNLKFPTSIVRFAKVGPGKIQHPTQKPVELLEWLIKTYSNENDLVLDPTMGSGSTGVACINTNRKFIGIEKDKKYYEVAISRIGKN